MNQYRLAIIKQKYRIDGGAENFVSQVLTALENKNIEMNIISRKWNKKKQKNLHVHICNPIKLGRISREKGFANAVRALWKKKSLILYKVMNVSQDVIFIEREMEFIVDGFYKFLELFHLGKERY